VEESQKNNKIKAAITSALHEILTSGWKKEREVPIPLMHPPIITKRHNKKS
jgi:hypothetical protein